MRYIKIWIFLFSIKLIPLLYSYLYEIYKKIPYPDFIEAMSMIVLVPPSLISEFTGATWFMKTSFDPSIIGIFLSLLMWLVVDAGMAFLIISLFFAKI